ncbi:MAG: ATP-binding cassette domain-containing protein [Eubacteriales bacterium]|nr:ATP-binding cassette domain-containing protein [Eubacteriales bacterium]
MNILKVENLSFSFYESNKNIINNINFSVDKGDFLLLQGANGAGKSTLLRLLKRELFYNGKKDGRVLYKNQDIESLENKESASKIAYLMQDVNDQIVTNKVWHELSFGLENLGVKQNQIRTKVAEMSTYFGIDNWFHKDVDDLSGGEKQILNLASLMVMDPEILLLDEPTSMLDPIASENFLNVIEKINKDFFTTIIIIEHKTDLIMDHVNKILFLENGLVKYFDSRDKVLELIKEDEKLSLSLPEVTRLFAKVSSKPILNIHDGRLFLEEKYSNNNDTSFVNKITKNDLVDEPIIKIKNLFFKYDKLSDDVIKDLSLSIYRGEILSLLGANGSGKSTLLKIMCALYKPYSGKIILNGKDIKKYTNEELFNGLISLLPQDAKLTFFKNTIEEELEGCDELYEKMPYNIKKLLKMHPYDLSGGEAQQVALAKILSKKPKILLLDEVSKGLDSYAKYELVKTLKKLQEQGITIVIVSHDIEFSIEVSNRCALLFGGEITSINNAKDFFKNNTFYTSKTSLVFKEKNPEIVSIEDGKIFLEKNKNGS